MSQQSNEIPNNQSIVIEDLDAKNAEEIKGGPVYMQLGDIKGESATSSATSGGGGAGKVQMQDMHFVAK